MQKIVAFFCVFISGVLVTLLFTGQAQGTTLYWSGGALGVLVLVLLLSSNETVGGYLGMLLWPWNIIRGLLTNDAERIMVGLGSIAFIIRYVVPWILGLVAFISLLCGFAYLTKLVFFS